MQVASGIFPKKSAAVPGFFRLPDKNADRRDMTQLPEKCGPPLFSDTAFVSIIIRRIIFPKKNPRRY